MSNGIEAWKILEDLSNQIDLVLTKVVTSGLPGIGLLSKIMSHKSCQITPVICELLFLVVFSLCFVFDLCLFGLSLCMSCLVFKNYLDFRCKCLLILWSLAATFDDFVCNDVIS